MRRCSQIDRMLGTTTRFLFGMGIHVQRQPAWMVGLAIGWLSVLPVFAEPTSGAPQAAATAKKPAERSVALLPGVVVNWELGVLEASGSCAADLYAPSADVARIKAERLARLRAEEKLRKGLQLLSGDAKLRAQLAPYGGAEAVSHLDPSGAVQSAVDYGAAGSVSLRLRLPLNPPAKPPVLSSGTGATVPDGGGQAPGDGGTRPRSADEPTNK